MKKYIRIIVILMMLSFVIPNKAYAAEKKNCYYANNDLSFRAYITFYKGTIYPGDATIMPYEGINGTVTILTYNGKDAGGKNIGIANIDQINTNNFLTTCPNSLSIGKSGKYFAYINEGAPYKKAQSGSNVTAEKFFGIKLICGSNGEECEIGEDFTLECNASLFGEPNYAGEESGIDTNGNGIIDPPSIAYLIKYILGIMRIIAIAAVIVLGTIDFGKAVLASKEDEMKKAQKTFIKRVIACICVFLVPTFINIVMNLANMAWSGEDYKACRLEEVTTGKTYSIKNSNR